MSMTADGKTVEQQVFDPKKVAADVQALANSDAPISALVREALDVIYQAFDEHGCILDFFYTFYA